MSNNHQKNNITTTEANKHIYQHQQNNPKVIPTSRFVLYWPLTKIPGWWTHRC